MNKAISSVRKLVGMLLLCVMASLPVYGYAELGRSEIREKIYKYCETEVGYSREEVDFNNLMKRKDGSWDFSLCVKKPEELTDGLIVGQINGDGTLEYINKPSPVSVAKWLKTEINRCLFSYQDIYQLKQQWTSRLNHISKEDQDEFDKKRKLQPILELLSLDIVLPDEDCISYDEAVDKSIKYIAAMDGWTAEMANHLGLRAELVYIPSGMDHPVYRFVYTPASSATFDRIVAMNEEYTSSLEKKIEKMEKEEESLFGEEILTYVGVRIDAYTGELIDNICVETSWMSCIGFIVWE